MTLNQLQTGGHSWTLAAVQINSIFFSLKYHGEHTFGNKGLRALSGPDMMTSDYAQHGHLTALAHLRNKNHSNEANLQVLARFHEWWMSFWCHADDSSVNRDINRRPTILCVTALQHPEHTASAPLLSTFMCELPVGLCQHPFVWP